MNILIHFTSLKVDIQNYMEYYVIKQSKLEFIVLK